MKKIILFLSILLVIGCKKKNTSQPPPANNPTPPTSSMNSTETALLGKWYLQKIEVRNNNTVTSTDSSDLNLSYCSFLSTNTTAISVGGYYADGYDCLKYNNNQPLSGAQPFAWKAGNDSLWISSVGTAKMLTLTANDLVFDWLPANPVQYYRWYYHK